MVAKIQVAGESSDFLNVIQSLCFQRAFALPGYFHDAVIHHRAPQWRAEGNDTHNWQGPRQHRNLVFIKAQFRIVSTRVHVVI